MGILRIDGIIRFSSPNNAVLAQGGTYPLAIVVWEDRRDGNYDVFAQKVLSDGELAWPLFADRFESGDTTLWSTSVLR